MKSKWGNFWIVPLWHSVSGIIIIIIIIIIILIIIIIIIIIILGDIVPLCIA